MVGIATLAIQTLKFFSNNTVPAAYYFVELKLLITYSRGSQSVVRVHLRGKSNLSGNSPLFYLIYVWLFVGINYPVLFTYKWVVEGTKNCNIFIRGTGLKKVEDPCPAAMNIDFYGGKAERKIKFRLLGLKLQLFILNLLPKTR